MECVWGMCPVWMSLSISVLALHGLIVFITEPYYHPSTNECDNVSTNDYGVIGGTNGTSSAGN